MINNYHGDLYISKALEKGLPSHELGKNGF